jgi:hypothetical protein
MTLVAWIKHPNTATRRPGQLALLLGECSKDPQHTDLLRSPTRIGIATMASSIC